jgi:uncharacterized spore protein YtfJ
MSEEFNEVMVTAVKNQEQAAELMEKLFAVAQPGAVYGEPVTIGEHTVITASEVLVGMGFGYGVGSGQGRGRRGRRVSEKETQEEAQEESGEGGIGIGAGGGGVSGGRPVAAISIGPDGIEAEPIVDVTRIVLAFFTTIGSMFFMLSKMRKASRS